MMMMKYSSINLFNIYFSLKITKVTKWNSFSFEKKNKRVTFLVFDDLRVPEIEYLALFFWKLILAQHCFAIFLFSFCFQIYSRQQL